jgi:hypothetical protein
VGNVCAGTVDSPLEAQIVCGVLATEGIRSFSHALGIGAGLLRAGFAMRPQQYAIVVSEADAERARELVAAGRDPSR